MAFSAKPQPNNQAAKKWAAGATVGAAQAETPNPNGQLPNYDPKAKPSKAFNLRLNDYELQLLRRAAEAEFCSCQALAKRILIRSLEKRVMELE